MYFWQAMRRCIEGGLEARRAGWKSHHVRWDRARDSMIVARDSDDDATFYEPNVHDVVARDWSVA